MNIKAFLFSLVLCISFPLISQHQLDWVQQVGSTFRESGKDLAVGADGSVVAVGYFTTTADFQTGSGVNNITANGGNDCYIYKLDQYGNSLWAVTFGGPFEDEVKSVDMDDDGNVYVTGTFHDTLSFDSTLTTQQLVSLGGRDVFIAAFSNSGAFLWAKSFGGTGNDLGDAIAVSDVFGVHLCGNFQTSVDFDPGPEVEEYPSVGTSAYVLKLTLDGEFVWVRTIQGPAGHNATGIKVTSDGSVVSSGWFGFSSSIDFDPGPEEFFLSCIGNDAYVRKLSSEGDFIWAVKLGLNSEDLAYGLDIDNQDNVYVSGAFKSTFDFDPGPGAQIVNSTGLTDVFICKLDAQGIFSWGHHFGGESHDYAYAVSVQDSLLHITGFFFGTTDLIPGPDSMIVTSLDNSRDAYIVTLKTNGEHVESRVLAGNFDEYGYGIEANSEGDIYLTGHHHGTCDFDPTSVYAPTPVNGAESDAFILKLSTCPTEYATSTETHCGSVQFAGETYSSSGIYTGYLTNALGCDSIHTLYLTIAESSDSLISMMDCQSVVVNEESYEQSGLYTQTFINSVGCDSILSIQVEILSEVTEVDAQACFNYSFNDQLILESGTYYDTLTNMLGCDSLIELQLQIDAVDLGITISDPVLQSTAVDADFQWLDCSDGFSVLDGEISAEFTATYNSVYAAEITQNGCVDTTDCLSVISLALDQHLTGQFRLFPNPTQGFVKIEVVKLNGSLSAIEVYDTSGRLILNQFDGFSSLDLTAKAEGLYFIHFVSERGSTVESLLIQR